MVIQAGQMNTRLTIPDEWKVLSIGIPVERADVILVDEQIKIPRMDVLQRRVVRGDVCDLPFDENEFDFALIVGAMEQLRDPGAFCARIEKVARLGFFEAVSPFQEWLAPMHEHHWMIGGENETVKFYPKPRGWTGYSECFSDLFFRSAYSTVLQGDVSKSPCMFVRFAWDGPFECKVEHGPHPGFAR